MAFTIGINVVETDGKTAPAIAGAPTSVAGLLLRSARGPTDRAVHVTNFQQFMARFGSFDARFAGAYAVHGFFLNGGQEAWVARVLGPNSAAASVTLLDRTGAKTLTLTAGYRGTAESGAWGNALYADVSDNPEFSTRLAATRPGNKPARLQGVAVTTPLDLTVAANKPARTLTLKIDGASTTLVVTFDNTTVPVLNKASLQDVVNAINARAGQGLAASASAGGLLLVSRTKGAASAVEVVTGGADDDTRKLLGFPDGTTKAAGAAAASPPAYDTVQVTSVAGFDIGAWVRLDDGLTQNWFQVGRLEVKDDGAGNKQYFVHWTEPANAADRNEYRVEDGATLSTDEFNLLIRQQGPTDPAPLPVETWEKVTLDPARPNYAPNRLNDPFAGSAYVVLKNEGTGPYKGTSAPAVGQGIRLGLATATTGSLARTQGKEGDDPSAPDFTAALGRFDSLAVQLVAAPEVLADGVLRAVTRAGLDYCAGATKGDCMWVGHTPLGRDEGGARQFGQEYRGAKVYGALYWPWVTVTDPIGSGPNPTRVIPPTGHVLGVYARVAQTRGIAKAPAGNEAVVQGALAVERDLTDLDHTDLVKNGSVNGIRNLPGAGIVIDASRTLSTDTRWLYVNVRQLFNYVKASLRDGLRWVKQEPNRDTLWNKIKYNAVTPFLLRLHAEGAFGPGKPSDVFTVVCGPENNPPAEIALGNLRVEVYFNPSRPAETIIIVIGQQEGAATAAEQ
jgi:phage tail sheath protein FI